MQLGGHEPTVSSTAVLAGSVLLDPACICLEGLASRPHRWVGQCLTQSRLTFREDFKDRGACTGNVCQEAPVVQTQAGLHSPSCPPTVSGVEKQNL